jgi:protein-S-isoprenylcysteine O-methyltransferase Ste14
MRMADVVAVLARRRVTLGFVAAAAAVWLSRPTWTSWMAGLLVAGVGEAIRVWAAGHLEKSREVTTSGPYRWVGHPLYLGSGVMALGVVVASRSVIVAALATLYMGTTITAAVRQEEAFLRRTFGDDYAHYQAGAAGEGAARRFSFARALRNREYRAVIGLLVGFALLALKVARPI